MTIKVCDNAGGIPPKVLDNIFSKYNTSKDDGTGIGLYLAKIIIQSEFGGSIRAFNEEDGACFEIMLPNQL